MIALEGLVKRFGQRSAIDGLTFHIGVGEVFGLLGPNGAGKTTTIRILTTLAKPTAGRVSIAGWQLPGQENKIKSFIGIVPQHFNLDPDLNVWENLELHGRLHRIERSERRQRIGELLEFVELGDCSSEKVQALSGGMKRRLMIARALLHRPQVLFLDEPTVGLDPQVRRRLWDLVRKLREDGITIVLTTHYIEEAANLCDRVAILDQGRLIAIDAPASLCRQAGEHVVEWMEEDTTKTSFFPTRRQAAAFAEQLTAAATIRTCNLEDVFVKLTGKKVY